MREASCTIPILIHQQYGSDTMSNTSAVQILRNPVRSLQETCASFLGGKRVDPASNPKAATRRSAVAAGSPGDDVSTQWLQTNWSDTNFEPRLP